MFLPMMFAFVFSIGASAFAIPKIKSNKAYSFVLLVGLCLVGTGIYLALPR